MYPPDPSGRRANEAIQLQYADPSQRAAYNAYEAAVRDRGRAATPLSEATPSASSTQRTRNSVPRTFEQPGHSSSQNRERRGVRTISDYTSSDGSNDPTPRQHTPRVRDIFWYCCRGGERTDHGPHNLELYSSCLVCGHWLCAYCREDKVTMRDRGALKPSDYFQPRYR